MVLEAELKHKVMAATPQEIKKLGKGKKEPQMPFHFFLFFMCLGVNLKS